MSAHVRKYGQDWESGSCKNSYVTRMKDSVDLMSGWDSDTEYERYVRNLSGLRRPAIPLPPNFGDGAARLSSPSGSSVAPSLSRVSSASPVPSCAPSSVGNTELSPFESVLLPYLQSVAQCLKSLPSIAGSLEELLMVQKGLSSSKSKYSKSVRILKKDGVSVAMGGVPEEGRDRSDDSHADKVFMLIFS